MCYVKMFFFIVYISGFIEIYYCSLIIFYLDRSLLFSLVYENILLKLYYVLFDRRFFIYVTNDFPMTVFF